MLLGLDINCKIVKKAMLHDEEIIGDVDTPVINAEARVGNVKIDRKAF
jgi:hypothetical protein